MIITRVNNHLSPSGLLTVLEPQGAGKQRVHHLQVLESADYGRYLRLTQDGYDQGTEFDCSINGFYDAKRSRELHEDAQSTPKQLAENSKTMGAVTENWMRRGPYTNPQEKPQNISQVMRLMRRFDEEQPPYPSQEDDTPIHALEYIVNATTLNDAQTKRLTSQAPSAGFSVYGLSTQLGERQDLHFEPLDAYFADLESVGMVYDRSDRRAQLNKPQTKRYLYATFL